MKQNGILILIHRRRYRLTEDAKTRRLIAAKQRDKITKKK